MASAGTARRRRRKCFTAAACSAPTIVNENAGDLLGGTVYEGYGPGTCNCQFTSVYPYAIGPRLGVAYQFAPKMVVRAGWGIVYGNTPDGAGTGAGWRRLEHPQLQFDILRGARGDFWPRLAVHHGADFPGQPRPGNSAADRARSTTLRTSRIANAGRPPRINQWNIALQRELTANMSVEAAYVGNRGVWLQQGGSWDLNALTPQGSPRSGLNLSSATDRALLTSPLNSALAASLGFSTPPYAGFPTTLTVAQSLRPYPQFGSLSSDLGALRRQLVRRVAGEGHQANVLSSRRFGVVHEVEDAGCGSDTQ